MKFVDHALQWAIQYLTSNMEVDILSYQKMIYTSYSIVYKIETTNGIFYLKLTPKTLSLESKLLAFLHQLDCRNIPKILAVNNELQCFLMLSCGDESLRHLFKGKADVDKLRRGISNYTSIQRQLEKDIQPLLSLGLPDWRLDKLPSLYNNLIQKRNLLLDDGLTRKELDRLLTTRA